MYVNEVVDLVSIADGPHMCGVDAVFGTFKLRSRPWNKYDTKKNRIIHLESMWNTCCLPYIWVDRFHSHPFSALIIRWPINSAIRNFKDWHNKKRVTIYNFLVDIYSIESVALATLSKLWKNEINMKVKNINTVEFFSTTLLKFTARIGCVSHIFWAAKKWNTMKTKQRENFECWEFSFNAILMHVQDTTRFT